MKDTVYHSLLRIATATLAIMLIFDSGLLSPVTHELSLDTQRYLANVIGIQARVEPTELNTLTAELTKRDKELTQREQAVSEREIAVSVATEQTDSSDSISTYIMSILLFILLVLIVTNYVLDYFRYIDKNRIASQNEKLV